MPEITSVETIRAKLREFDERMDGAISAAKTLARIKTDAEKIGSSTVLVELAPQGGFRPVKLAGDWLKTIYNQLFGFKSGFRHGWLHKNRRRTKKFLLTPKAFPLRSNSYWDKQMVFDFNL